MSADNWAKCPFCIEAAQVEFERLAQELEDSYGIISADEFIARSAEMPEEFDPASVEETLREDYELGFEYDSISPVGYIIYSARCTKCGANVKVNDSMTLEKGK